MNAIFITLVMRHAVQSAWANRAQQTKRARQHELPSPQPAPDLADKDSVRRERRQSMLRPVPLASVSSRRHSSSLRSRPVRIAAYLDLQQESERAVHALLLRLSTGRWPRWRLLAMRRFAGLLLVAVEWCRDRSDLRFSRVTLSLSDLHLRWTDFATAREARQALRL